MDTIKFFERSVNFFRKKPNDEFVGVSFDNKKIFLVRLTDKEEFAESEFNVIADKDFSAEEQLAEKISLICLQRGWKTSATGLCLDDDTVKTFELEFPKIPAAETEKAVKSWVYIHLGEGTFFDFEENDGKIWAETLQKEHGEKFLDAFKKNSVNLVAMSAFPHDDSEKNTLADRAKFIAEVAKSKSGLNLLPIQNEDLWDKKKICLAAAMIYAIFCIILFAKLALIYPQTIEESENAKQNVRQHSDLAAKKISSEKNIAELQSLNRIGAELGDKNDNFNFLLTLGKIPAEKISLKKIESTGKEIEIEGVAENSSAIKNYLNKLKSYTTNAKLNRSAEDEGGQMNFSISVNFD